MALMRTTMRPGRSPWEATEQLYGGALSRWLGRQKQMTTEFGLAEQPLLETKALYAKGGEYGAGQRGIAEEQFRKSRAEALHNLVASGMSSGSLATGINIAARGGLEQAYRNIEDIRTERYSDALSRLSTLRAGLGQLYGTVQEPSYAPAAGAFTSIYGADVGLTGQQTGIQGRQQVAGMQISAADRLAKLRESMTRQHLNTPVNRLSII